MSLLALTLDRISPGNVPNHAQFKAWDKLVTQMVELNKEFAEKFDKLVREKRAFASAALSREDIKDLPGDKKAEIINGEAAVTFKGQNDEIDRLGDEVVTFEIDEITRSFVQSNFDTIVFPGLTQLNATRGIIIEIAEQFLETQVPTAPAEVAPTPEV